MLGEFILDANKKNELELEFEIEFFHPDENIQTLKSFGRVYLNKPELGSILIKEKATNNEYVIFPDNELINFSKYDISEEDKLCFLKIENKENKVKKYIGIISSITLGLDHPVTISTDSNGTDWTGYLGGIIFFDEE